MNRRMCPDCFHEVRGGDYCGNCGYNLAGDKREKYHLPAGMTLENRYIIGKVLKSGGFGIVYKAWDTELEIPVAIKELFIANAVQRDMSNWDVIVVGSQEEYQKEYTRFLNEAKNTAKFREHPPIIDVFNFFTAHNTAYMVMEYLEGLDLQEYLKTVKEKLDFEDTKAVFGPIMSALQAVHGKKILHRDISPDNIFITIDNHIKLLDFGAARFSSEEDERTITQVVKPGYAPPEQYQQKSRQGPWTDIYALGATIYRTLTGKKPEESIDRALNDQLKKPSELGVDMPVNAEKAVMRALAIKPSLRFSRVEEMRKAFYDEKNIDWPEITEKKRRRRTILAGAALLIAAIATVVSGYAYRAKNTIDASFIDPDSIVIWVPVDQGASRTQLDDLTEGFLSIEGNEGFEVELVAVPQSEYEQRLLEAYGSDKFPDIFRGDIVGDNHRIEMSAELEKYYSNFGNSNYYLLNDYKSELLEDRLVPVGFSIPVAYANLSLLARIGQDEPEEFSSPEDFIFDISRLIDRDIASYCLVADSDELETIATMLEVDVEAIEASAYQNGGYADAFEAFAARNAVIYIGRTNELTRVQDEENLRGAYTTVPIYAENIYAEWGDCYCISIDSNENRQKLAMLYLSYLSGSAGSSGFPLEKEAFAAYVQSNEYFLGFMLEDLDGHLYVERVQLLPQA